MDEPAKKWTKRWNGIILEISRTIKPQGVKQ